MKSSEIFVVVIAVGLALFGASILWPDSQVAEIVNSAIDAIVVLTTSEETRLQQLEPETQEQVRGLIQDLANLGIAVHVGQTLRTNAQEAAAIASGHSGVKSKSWHESGRAVDLYPINPDTLQPDMNGVRDDLFVQMQQAAVARGFHQIAYDDYWQRKYITNAQGKKIWDGGHVEWHGPYQTASEAYNAYVADDTQTA